MTTPHRENEVKCIQARELVRGDWIRAFRRKFIVHSILYTSAGVFVDTHEPGEQKSIKFTFDTDFAVPVDLTVHARQIADAETDDLSATNNATLDGLVVEDEGGVK
ncbi:MAG: hypothetical protein V1685_04520 [Parcubacteria group bacterium]